MRAFLLETVRGVRLSTSADAADRESGLRIGLRRGALRFDENRPARAETAQGIVEPGGATATSSAGVALSRSGPRKRAVRWNDPSLLSTTPGPTSATQGRKSARLADLVRYSAKVHHGRTQVGYLGCADARDIDETADRAWPPRPPRNGRLPRWRGRPSQSRRPRPIGPGQRAVEMASARGAPPSRIGSVSARWTGT
jgi:hypothetical protein